MVNGELLTDGWSLVKGEDIQERMLEFAVSIIKTCSSLPRTETGRHVGGQLLRCGTSGAPNYAEARAAESRNDFVHKLGIVLKELNETAVWLEMIRRSELLPADRIDPVARECDELCRIIGASIRTVGKPRRQ